jgi:hypothetical protein
MDSVTMRTPFASLARSISRTGGIAKTICLIGLSQHERIN